MADELGSLYEDKKVIGMIDDRILFVPDTLKYMYSLLGESYQRFLSLFFILLVRSSFHDRADGGHLPLILFYVNGSYPVLLPQVHHH